jgi:hypothetical protein
LPAGTTVSLYPVVASSAVTSLVPAGQSYLASFAVFWQAPDGTSPAATTAISLTITDPNIKAGDTIYQVTSAGTLKAVGTASANGSVVITFTSYPTFILTSGSATATTTTMAPPRKQALRAFKVVGVALVGRSVLMYINGIGFYGQPKITSTLPRTRVGVLQDTGRRLKIRVTTQLGVHAGWRTFTIRLADGRNCKVNYLVK